MPATKQLSAFCVVLFSLLGVCRALLGTPETVFVAHSNNLINFTVNGNHLRYRTWASPVTEQRQFGEVRGLDCEKRKELLCWVDKKVNAIRCSSTQPKAGCSDDSPTTFLAVNIVSNNGKPEGVALDPCNMMLYWTDPSRSTISVAKLQRDDKGDIRAVMTKDILTAKNGLSKPFGIAVDSCAGYIFFTDVGSEARLARAETDGSNLRTLLAKVSGSSYYQDLKSPKALALDRRNRHVYLGDAGLSAIYKMTYEGQNVNTVVSKIGEVYDMALQCDRQNLFYSTTLRPYPVLLQLKEGKTHRLAISQLGQRVYYGACSYCDDCTCSYYRNRCSRSNGHCSHFCFPRKYSRNVCGCPAGYKLSYSRRCVAESPQLLVSNATKLVSLISDSTGNSLEDPHSLSFGSLNRMVALDYVIKSGNHYIAYTDGSAVKRRGLDGTEDITITNGLPDPRGIATDCVTGNIYYADMQKPIIAVSNTEGTSHKVCLKSPQVKKPFSLALNTRKGVLYFSDLGKGGIFSYSMDCTGGYARYIASAHAASGLALDDNAQVLYWTEFYKREVKLYNIQSGGVRAISITDRNYYMRKPFGLTVLGNYLFFTSWENGCIGRIPKHGGEIRAVSCNRNANLQGISHVHSPSVCRRPSGSCGYCPRPRFCMLSSDRRGSFECVCPEGFISSGSGCTLRNEDFILVSARHSIMALSLQGSSSWIAKLPLPPQENIIALDYDYTGKKVFWTDVKTKKIYSAKLDGTNMEVLLSHDSSRDQCRLCHPDGLAYDWTNGQLYYTDYASGEICYINVKMYGKKTPQRVLNGLHWPRAIVVDPRNRKLYFSEWGTVPRISSLSIGNRYPQALISTNVTWPNALTISRDRSKLYFGDAGKDYVASYNLYSRRVYPLSSTPHIFGIDQYTERYNQQYIYWSDWQLGVLKQSVNGGRIQQLATSSDVYRASGIRVFSRR